MNEQSMLGVDDEVVFRVVRGSRLTHAGDKTVLLGVLDLATDAPLETPEHIEMRARAAMEETGPDRLGLAPDCGMWFLPRDTARAKVAAMETAAAAIRATL